MREETFLQSEAEEPACESFQATTTNLTLIFIQSLRGINIDYIECMAFINYSLSVQDFK